jgi:hypothetical protein
MTGRCPTNFYYKIINIYIIARRAGVTGADDKGKAVKYGKQQPFIVSRPSQTNQF